MVFFEVPFFWVFLGFYLLHHLVVFFLDRLNIKHVTKQKEVPKPFVDFISESVFEKSKAYTIEKLEFGILSRVLMIPFFWFLIVLGFFNTFDAYAAHFGGIGTLSQSVLFCVFVSAYFLFIGLPFRYYNTFVIEEKYGFNKTTIPLFVIDLVKTIVIGALLGIPLLYVVFWFMKNAGGSWWFLVWLTIMGFQFFVAAVYPMVFAPIFNKFIPMKDEALKEKIEALAKKINFKMSGVFTIDGSRRSGHSNAYFAGLGKFRRIVLFDTITKQMEEQELLAVLAHEMGHNVKKHILKSVILSSAMTLIALYVISFLINWQPFYQSFNIANQSPHTALVIFAIASEMFTFLLTPLLNLWSRKNEFEADRFSVETTKEKSAMKSALIKLSKENLSNLDPHPIYSFYHYSHPTVSERIRAIDDIPT